MSEPLRCTQPIEMRVIKNADRYAPSSRAWCDWCGWHHDIWAVGPETYTTESGRVSPSLPSRKARRLTRDELQRLHDENIPERVRFRRPAAEPKPSLPPHLRSGD